MDIYPEVTEQWRIELLKNPPKSAEAFLPEEWRHIVLNELIKTHISVKPFLGRKHTEETKKKMSLSAMGNQRTPKGYKFSNRKPRTWSPEQLATRKQRANEKEQKIKLRKAKTIEIQERKKALAIERQNKPKLLWWNNSKESIMTRYYPGEGWIKGRVGWSLKNQDGRF